MAGRGVLARVGEVAWLRVVTVDDRGAWLDWGHPKDLLLPYKEQQGDVLAGQYCLVRVFMDDDERPTASMRLDEFLAEEAVGLEPNAKVSLVVADTTDLGVKVVVNHRYWGLVYANEVFKRLRKGQKLDGWVKPLRADGRLDISLNPLGYGAVQPLVDVIVARLEARGGFLPLHDKSPPEAIQATFGVSKKVFKQAVGALYKQGRITLEPEGIRLRP